MLCTSQGERLAMSTGRRRLAHSIAAMPAGTPAMVPMFSFSTRRKPKCGRSGSGSFWRRATDHRTRPVATMAQPARLHRK